MSGVVDDLTGVKITALKKIAKVTGLTGYTKYKSGDESQLRAKIRSARRKFSPASAKSSRGSIRSVHSRPAHNCFTDPCPSGEYCKLNPTGRQKRCTKTRPANTTEFITSDGKKIVGSASAIAKLQKIIKSSSSKGRSSTLRSIASSTGSFGVADNQGVTRLNASAHKMPSSRSSRSQEAHNCITDPCPNGEYCKLNPIGRQKRCTKTKPANTSTFITSDGKKLVGSASAISKLEKMIDQVPVSTGSIGSSLRSAIADLSGCAAKDGTCPHGKVCSISESGNGRCLSKTPKNKPASVVIDGVKYVGSTDAISKVKALKARSPGSVVSKGKGRAISPASKGKGRASPSPVRGSSPFTRTVHSPVAGPSHSHHSCVENGCSSGYCTAEGCVSSTKGLSYLTTSAGKKVYGSPDVLAGLKSSLGGVISSPNVTPKTKSPKRTVNNTKILEEFKRCIKEL